MEPQNFGIIRFRLPNGQGGTYRLESAVLPYLTSGTGDTDFHVLRNGTEIFGQFLPGTSATGYTNELTLNAGDTIDFAIGRGADGHLAASGLIIQARIATIAPQPTYDLSHDFSAISNPAGAWSYGWISTLSGPFTLLTFEKNFSSG